MNEAQLEAVMTRVPNVLVSAGAGSGKTRVLTQRYFHLLDDGLTLDQILTLTFTRKAAQEMRERIARKLDEEGRVYERRKLMRAPIGTIHSYCERVLREYALDAGIDPNFRLLDDAEARTLQENALDTIFEDVWSGTQQEREEIGRLLLDFPQSDLRESLLGVFRTARTQGLAIEGIAVAPPADRAAAAAEVHAAIRHLLGVPGTAAWQQKLTLAEDAYTQLGPVLDDATRPFGWQEVDLARALLPQFTPPGGPREVAKLARDRVKAAMDGWICAGLDEVAAPYLSAFLALLQRFDAAYRQAKDDQSLLDFEDLLLRTRDLLERPDASAAARLRAQFAQVMVDEFQDTNPLQFGIVRALQGEGHLFAVGDVKQAIYRFIGSDISVFLGQERRIMAMEGTGQRIPMLTNYRTRPEVLEVLNGLFARLWPLPDADDEEQFVFEPLSAGQQFVPKDGPSVELALWTVGEDRADALRDREATWIARRILQLTGRLDEPALQITGKRDGPDDPVVGHGADLRDVIILFRASTDIPRYEEALRDAGIPFYTVSGRGFYQAREVQDLLHLLRVLENPMDDFSLAVVLRSPLVGVRDDTLYWLARDWAAWQEGDAYPGEVRRQPQYGRLWAAIARVETLPPIAAADVAALRQFRDLVQVLQAELPAGHPLDLIDLILQRTKYADCLLAGDGGEQRYANVQKLREVAADFQARGIFDLSDFQRYLTQLERLAPREASAPLDVEGSNVVRLMTVHASKGLEAPIVFLADGGREPNRITDRILFDPRDGVACKAPSPTGDFEDTGMYRRIAQRQAAGDRREAERLLYVALTRAREHLICCGFTAYPQADQCASYADILAGTLGIFAPPDTDTDLPVEVDGAAYPVRLWSEASLQTVEALAPPTQHPTLWKAHHEAIGAGQPLPLVTGAEEVERFARITARLQELPPVRRTGPLRVGVHRLLCYRTCPRQYWFRYVLNQEGSLSYPALTDITEGIAGADGDDEQERLDGTAFGTMMHRVLQHIDFRSPFAEQLPALLAKFAVESGTTVGEADSRRVAACLQRFAGTPLHTSLCRATVLHRELRFLARERDVYVPGIIDLLAEVDGRWWVIDYKTGHAAANHRWQVGLYALGLLHTLGVMPDRTALVYLEPRDPAAMVSEEPVNAALLDRLRGDIRDAGDGLRRSTAEAFCPQAGRWCARCPYQSACPDAQQGAEQGTLL